MVCLEEITDTEMKDVVSKVDHVSMLIFPCEKNSLLQAYPGDGVCTLYNLAKGKHTIVSVRTLPLEGKMTHLL